MKRVLVTGATGYIGSHTAIQLLNLGYKVIGTTRNQNKAPEIKAIINSQVENGENFSIVEANLMDGPEIWQKHMEGVDYIIHVASPLPRVMPKNPDDIIIPARSGVLNVLQAASISGIKRVVLTSSFAAIAYGVKKQETFNESDWTDENNLKDTNAYIRSKAIAEKAAWDFMKSDESGMELTTVNPALVLGPVIDKKDYGTSVALILKMMDGSVPALPKIGYSIVDVRSVADMHIKAMTVPAAAGERFLCANTYMTMKEIADVLRERFPKRKIPKLILPDFVLRFFAKIDKETAPVVMELGAKRNHDYSKAKRMLNWEPISDRQSIIDTAESLIDLGFVNDVRGFEST